MRPLHFTIALLAATQFAGLGVGAGFDVVIYQPTQQDLGLERASVNFKVYSVKFLCGDIPQISTLEQGQPLGPLSV